MSQMLRQKGTGDLFIYTAALAALPDMELIAEDPVVVTLAEIAAESTAEALSMADELEAALEDTAPPEEAPKKSKGR